MVDQGVINDVKGLISEGYEKEDIIAALKQMNYSEQEIGEILAVVMPSAQPMPVAQPVEVPDVEPSLPAPSPTAQPAPMPVPSSSEQVPAPMPVPSSSPTPMAMPVPSPSPKPGSLNAGKAPAPSGGAGQKPKKGMSKLVLAVIAIVVLGVIAVVVLGIGAVAWYFWFGGLATQQPTPMSPATITAYAVSCARSQNEDTTIMVANTSPPGDPINTAELSTSIGSRLSCDDAILRPGQQTRCTLPGSDFGQGDGMISIYGSDVSAATVSC